MTAVICEETIVDSWFAGLEHLINQPDREELNLVTTITNPNPSMVAQKALTLANTWLLREGLQKVETVANTIFPSSYLRGVNDREQFYERYRSNFPKIRKHSGNHRGTYFARLIDYPRSSHNAGGSNLNQIEEIIGKLKRQIDGKRPMRFAYEAQIFSPELDARKIMSFPCLSYVSFQLMGSSDQRKLCLTAVYRNQYYFQRALGNMLGLARLLAFVAEEIGIEVGSLTVHACHAEIDLGLNKTRQLIHELRDLPR